MLPQISEVKNKKVKNPSANVGERRLQYDKRQTLAIYSESQRYLVVSYCVTDILP